MNLSDLEHIVVRSKTSAALVLVLQDGAIITAEDRAMLQALYSRSPASVFDHLEKLAKVGSGKFMQQFYVGYAHKSIGDCGSTTIFIENVSMLAAKAIQDSELYDGQEVSTRYVDFATQPFVNPLELGENNPQNRLRNFYLKALPVLKDDIKLRFPIGEGEKDDIYEKAVAARAFDILRGYLPAGAQTSLAWTSNLRQVADKLAYLRAHKLQEVREIAALIEEAVMKAHPHSFTTKRYEASEDYREKYMGQNYYFAPNFMVEKVILRRNSLDTELLRAYSVTLKNRPAKTEVPRALAEIGTLQFEFLLDFGSYRDIARHRAVTQRMPLVTTKYGFQQWYLDELPDELQKEAQSLLYEVKHWWRMSTQHHGMDQAVLQYYLPMGYQVSDPE
jgi:thymidylate synthase ThyX